MLLNCGVGEDSWESLGLQGDPTLHSKGDQSQVFIGRTDAKFGHLMGRVDSLETTLMLGGIGGRRRRGQQRMRWLDGITDSMDMWVNSGSWWWTGRPGVLRFMGSQRVGHKWATELNWREEGEAFQMGGMAWANTERWGDCGKYQTGKPWGGNLLPQTTDITVSPLRGQGTSWSCPWSWTKAPPLLTAIFVYPRILGVSAQFPQSSQVSLVFSNIIFLSLILPSCCKNRSLRKEFGYFSA